MTKARLIVYGYAHKCADWHWGALSQFGHIAGNIYFALPPAEEDPAALHVFILHCHCAAHLAAPDQSSSPDSLWFKFKTDTDVILVSHTYSIIGDLHPDVCKNLISKCTNVQNAILS